MSSRETADEVLSEATVEDLQDVLDMSGDVYNGLDYVSATFPHLVEGPGVKAFRYKVKGELVAFASTVLVDAGRTLLIVAARVKESHQGGGVYSRFRRQLLTRFADRRLYPSLRCEVMSADGGNRQVNGDKFRKSGFREIVVKHNTQKVFEVSSLQQLTAKTADHQVTIVTPDDLKQLLQQQPDHWLHLFPRRRLVVAWKPFMAMPENVPFLVDLMNSQFYGTKSGAGQAYTLLSVGTYYRCQLGVCYSVDIFGTADRQEVRDHVLVHLQRLKAMAHTLTGKVVLRVFTSERLDDVVSDVTLPLNAVTMESLDQFRIMSVWERDLTD